ncbi:glycosyltransferase family 2 protein [Affinirhizobium pseudoryzae]|uniref:glycosyltransferase family 2 protein n=1 Tax=Allorhizobium pseudoryzae TaxID=379684 RepID=UPI0013E9DB66|nr:glycosyltransferase family 2 protein [Allorhizobium pseudoryzae]
MTSDFSVIIPTYNSEKSLGAALSSCLHQGASVEVIVIDGASRDRTVEIAAAHEARPVILSEPDKGIYDAINKGLKLATGRLIGILGSDDELEAGALSKLNSLHKRTETDIVFGAANMVSPSGDVEVRKDEAFGPGALLSGIPFCHNAMFVTQDCVRRVGEYDNSLKICADAAWVHRAIRLGCTASGIPDPVVRFSLGGVSSVSAAEIMAETYGVIAANFSSITAVEAKVFIEAVRRWGAVEPALEIARRYPHDRLLQEAVAHAFGGIQPSVASAVRPSLRRRIAARLLRLLRSNIHSA